MNETCKTKKTYKLSFRLDAAEKQQLEQKLKAGSLTLSQFMRQAITSAQVEAKLSPEELALVKNIIPIANNLNQVAKSLHMYKDTFTLSPSLITLKGEIEAIIKKLKAR